jgi:hypothetical protein
VSREVIDELMETLKTSRIDDFADILESVVEYGFAAEVDLCKAFEVESSDLDGLVSGSENLTDKQWKKYSTALYRYLKRIRGSYERLYYKDSARK